MFQPSSKAITDAYAGHEHSWLLAHDYISGSLARDEARLLRRHRVYVIAAPGVTLLPVSRMCVCVTGRGDNGAETQRQMLHCFKYVAIPVASE